MTPREVIAAALAETSVIAAYTEIADAVLAALHVDGIVLCRETACPVPWYTPVLWDPVKGTP